MIDIQLQMNECHGWDLPTTMTPSVCRVTQTLRPFTRAPVQHRCKWYLNGLPEGTVWRVLPGQDGHDGVETLLNRTGNSWTHRDKYSVTGPFNTAKPPLHYWGITQVSTTASLTHHFDVHTPLLRVESPLRAGTYRVELTSVCYSNIGVPFRDVSTLSLTSIFGGSTTVLPPPATVTMQIPDIHVGTVTINTTVTREGRMTINTTNGPVSGTLYTKSREAAGVTTNWAPFGGGSHYAIRLPTELGGGLSDLGGAGGTNVTFTDGAMNLSYQVIVRSDEVALPGDREGLVTWTFRVD